jgi:peptidoglycan/xylan/chitin deacetylase (PgdA/CDA1 family)
LFDLHQRRWAEEGKPGVFRSEKKREFYAVLSERLLERGWLAFTWLEFKGQVLACQYGFRYRDTYYQLQEGYESDSGHWNVGIGLRAWCIRKFIAEGVREYDFLGGVGRHKTDWGAQVKHSKCIEIATRNPRNLLFSHGAQYEARAREAIARMLPKKLLALRKARLAATPLNVEASTAQTGRFSTRQWAAKAAASVYCHSGLPTLTRRVRSRYELSMDGDGAVLRRRRQPSGRIFCYHRVNDNNDPFFPATPTKVFENEIRYAARHYRVVSLTEMLSCLDAGSPAEPLIAVTFDDGYRDNFENALPILERYGVPSTIFLATGIIDSAECLWFEQMADCLKNTSREFIDLELDIPRRFWLRTERERLNANLRILGLLRNTPDIIRRQRLEEIVKCLPFDGPRKPAEMLSWDQIRRMKASRVDFGGHTVTHPFLSRATPEQACWEVSECKRRIEEETQSSVDYFAYPNGQAEDFAGHDRDLLRHAGYRAAVTTLWGVNYQATERMQLRRSGPWDSDPAMFASRLDWYQLRNE